MTRVEPAFYFRNECIHPESSIVLSFSHEPSVGCIEIVLDYQGGAGAKRDFRRWKFDGVQSLTRDGKPWEEFQEEWQVFVTRGGGKYLAGVETLSVSPVRAVSGKLVAHRLGLGLDYPVGPVIFTFTSMSVEQRFGVAVAMPGGRSWTYRDAVTGKHLDFYQPFPKEEAAKRSRTKKR